MTRVLLALILIASCTADNWLQCKRNTMHRGWRISGPGACEVKPRSKPLMVQIGTFIKGGCGGTLIGPRVVLTALHCSTETRWGHEVIIGSHNVRTREYGEQRRKVEKLVPYLMPGVKNWIKASFQVDVLLLILDKRVDITTSVQIANLPKPGSKCPKNLQVCGWGHDKFNERRSLHNLYCVRQTCLPKSKCDRKH